MSAHLLHQQEKTIAKLIVFELGIYLLNNCISAEQINIDDKL